MARRKPIIWSNEVFGFDNIDGDGVFYALGGDTSMKPAELAKVNHRGISIAAVRVAIDYPHASLEQVEDGVRAALRLSGIEDRIQWDRQRERMKTYRTAWPKIADTITAALRGELEFG
jgi:hypothetical protein